MPAGDHHDAAPGRAAVPISAFIIALNEADRIGSAIRSVRAWADEVVVVDSGSTDGTQALAEELGARVVFNPWPGYGPQKRFAEDQCQHDWLFNLDADETVTPDLAEEIQALVAQGPPKAAFWRIDIADAWPHEAAPARWAFRYRQIRLYDRREGRFADSTVHDTVRPPAGAEIRSLNGVMAHRSERSIAAAIAKANAYSDMQVTDMRAKGRQMPRWRLLTEFPLAFLKSYILRRSALYGWWGVVNSTTYAYGRFLRVAKSYEAQLLDRRPTSDED
jgi:glycosyltransferase involved in cell wall biosynthesis